MPYCNVWKLNCEDYRYIPIELDSGLNLDKTNQTFKNLLENNEGFASKVKNGDLIIDMSDEQLGYKMDGVYIILYSCKNKDIEVLYLSTYIDEYGYIPIEFSDLVLKNEIDYWHNMIQLQKNVYILNETNIVKQNYLEVSNEETNEDSIFNAAFQFEFNWTNKYIPIFPSTIETYIKEQDVTSIEITIADSIIYLLNIININDKKLGIISRKDLKIIKIRKGEEGKYYFDNSLVDEKIRCRCADITKPDDINYMNNIYLAQEAEKDIDYYYEIINNDEDIIESLQNQDHHCDDHKLSECIEFIKEVKKYIEIHNCIFKLTKSKYELINE